MNTHLAQDVLAELQEERSIEWRCPQPGLRAGVDNVIDAIITLHGPRVLRWMNPGSSVSARPGDPAVNGLRDVSLSLSTPSWVEVQPLSDLDGGPRSWRLPDMQWTQSVSVAFRFCISAAHASDVNAMVLLARAKLTATAVHSDGADQSVLRLALPIGAAVLSCDEFEGCPRDEQAQRLLEGLRGHRPAQPSMPTLIRNEAKHAE